MRALILLVFVGSILSTACHKDKKNPPGPACGNDITLNKNAPLRNDVLRLTREYAMVKRTDCQGKESIARETVKEPKEAYSLQAQTLGPDSGEYEVSALNRTTCDVATIKKRKATENRMEIQFNTSPGTRRTYVLKNQDNIIDYEFRRCLARDATNKCVSSELAERGTVVLHVEYEEKDLPGLREYKAPCSNPAAPQP